MKKSRKKRVLKAWKSLLDSGFIDELTLREWLDTQRYKQENNNSLVFQPEVVATVEDVFLGQSQD